MNLSVIFHKVNLNLGTQIVVVGLVKILIIESSVALHGSNNEESQYQAQIASHICDESGNDFVKSLMIFHLNP